MTKSTLSAVRAFPAMNFLGAPRVVFDPTETPSADDAAAKAAADKAAAEAAALAAAQLEESEAEEREAAEALKRAEEAGKDTKALAGEQAKLVREVMAKKTALKAAEATLAETRARLDAYEGVDPAKVKELLKKEADAEQAAAEARGDFDRVKAMMAEEHAKELKKVQDELAAERTARVADAELITNLTIGNDFNGSTFIRESLIVSPTKARVLYGAHFEIKDGKTVAFDKPAGKPNRTMLVDASGEPLPFDQAIGRIVDADPDKETLLRAKNKPGSASSSTPAAGKTPGDKDGKPELFGAARIAAGLRAGSRS